MTKQLMPASARPATIAIGSGLIFVYLGIVVLPILYVTIIECNAILFDNFLVFAKTILKPYLWVVIMVCLASLAGMGVPAWRATRVQPMDVIRDE